ncbi:hypothetical protein K2173_015542 [Erythroxylum novogranatense]|uniref:Uncharacterized protein n=1 Tax=Erythroxylum novogranatense TaxID=1862640 RepID=A0AAV8SSL4_9ROSI|nr:hypothetical protein K2173_015542 [Erythroxylum novogranatense]
MGRRPCCVKEGLNKGAWTEHEDRTLIDYVSLHGEGKWRDVPQRAGLKRCGKSCRLRWVNYLRPDIKRGNISQEEEELIIKLHRLLGNRWSLIAGRLPGRTDNEIKNYWNTNLSKRVHRNATHQDFHKQPHNSEENKGIQDFHEQSHNSEGNKSIQNVSNVEAEKLVESNKVIRTKAVRLTRVITIPQRLHNLHDNIRKIVNDHQNPSSWSPLDDNSFDFPKEFNGNDFLLLETLSSEFNLNNETNEIENHEKLIIGDGDKNGCSNEPFLEYLSGFEENAKVNIVTSDTRLPEARTTCEVDPSERIENALYLDSLETFLCSEDAWNS